MCSSTPEHDRGVEHPRACADAGTKAVVRTGPVTLQELCAGLIWPRLFDAMRLSLHPSRVLVGVAAAVIIGGLWWALGLVWAPESAATTATSSAAAAWQGPATGSLRAWMRSEVVTWRWAVLGLLAWPVWAIAGGAIARSAALDFSLSVSLGLRASVRFALRRAGQLALSIAPPLLLIGVLLGGAAVAGLVLRGVLENVGGVLYGGVLLACVLAAAVAVALAVAKLLLIPAVVVDGSDVFDAVQRAYAYTMGRTLRLLVYVAVLGALGWLGLAIIEWITTLGLVLANRLTEIGDPVVTAAGVESAEGFAAGARGAWEWLLRAAVAGWMVSYVHCAGVVLYLLVRRVNDEQGIGEIYMEPSAGERTGAPAGDPGGAPPAELA